MQYKYFLETTMPSTTDLSGMETTLDPSMIGRWNDTIMGILSHSADAGVHLNAVIDGDPDFALAQAIRGVSCLLLGRREMVSVAQEAHAAAVAAARRRMPTAREMAFVDALGYWLAGHPSKAGVLIQEQLDKHPTDALAMKMVHAILFVMGDPKGMRKSIEGVLGHWDGHQAHGYLMGCHAFSLEETGDYALAEKIGRKGVELAPRDAWGLHAVAHVYDMTGRADQGLKWLDGREESWAHCNNFRFHVWWHRALMHLDMGEYDAALDLYDREVRAEQTDDYRDISNGASMLSRLEIEGVDVGNRWEELADISERRSNDGVLAFADLHYLLALIGGERETAVKTLVGNMAKARNADGEASKIIHHPGHDVALGLQEFASGNFPAAWIQLREARGGLQAIGGSHAQRDVFQRITIEAAIRGGYLDAAQMLLDERTTQRGGYVDGYTMRRLDLIASARGQAV